ncbi:hypothetical protein A33O_00910 [Nitratireductor aquibiodomus RA22]|uniref:Uncharacterized protein n=2 Tax=Nitratireductor aquibiodomus TaxID=204799 RepID=A0A1H4LX56_9HYPH|nr:hypothetical protein [Nitratireductor aquibiodomus]EIM77895.1 hypothetical protein A33O_00910 [Nitratireductor aquibiodomus RA22]SEB75157.1 hypothetical protein SAMN05216452_3034 [Nitratireductor aquibiodomus]
MKKLTLGFAVIVGAVLAGPVQSADLSTGGYCPVAQNARLLSIESNASLTGEVIRLMDEAVAVADSPQWINSGRPAFVWASEAKVACGKAYGYLQSEYRDEDYLNKCECFHARMVRYMY